MAACAMGDNSKMIVLKRWQPISDSEIPLFCSSVLRYFAPNELSTSGFMHPSALYLTSPTQLGQASYGSAILTYGCCVRL